MILDLELISFVLDFVNKDLKFDSRAIFRVDKLIDDFVELIGASVQVNVKISELSENKLFSLSVFQEKEGDQVLMGQLDEFLGGHDFLLAKIVLNHESVHRSIKLDLVICWARKIIFNSENFNNLFG